MGKTKGKIVKAGVKGSLTLKDSEEEVIAYDQPLAEELGIVEGAAVTLTLLRTGTETMAVAVAPINKGEITQIDYERGGGIIFEKESNVSYRFVQNYLKESGFAVGDKATYNLVRLDGGKLVAVCLEKAANDK